MLRLKEIFTSDYKLFFETIIHSDNSKEIERLLEKKVDIHSDSQFAGCTALYMAVQHQRKEIIKILHKRFGKNHHSILGHAVACDKDGLDSHGIVRFLVENTSRDLLNWYVIGFVTPLQIAFHKRNIHLFQMLLENGADPNNRFPVKMNLLDEAIDRNKIDHLMLLIKHGAILINYTKLFLLIEKYRDKPATEKNIEFRVYSLKYLLNKVEHAKREGEISQDFWWEPKAIEYLQEAEKCKEQYMSQYTEQVEQAIRVGLESTKLLVSYCGLFAKLHPADKKSDQAIQNNYICSHMNGC